MSMSVIVRKVRLKLRVAAPRGFQVRHLKDKIRYF